MRGLALIACAAGLIAAPVDAQSPISRAIAGGEVGERFDGYMGVTGAPSIEVRRQVAAINIRRRKLYTELSTRRNVTTELVGKAAACQLLTRLGPGEAYLLQDGVWRRYAAGQAVPLPDYCG